MALDTAQKRASAMLPMVPFRPILVLPSGTISGAIRQAIALLYSGIAASSSIVIGIYQDLNTRLFVYLCAYYGTNTATSDLTTLTNRYLKELTGDYTARMRRLIQDATDAMQ